MLKDEKLSKESVDPLELRKKCTATALHYLDVQREEFKRLGVFGEWDKPYITLDPGFETLELRAFADMVEKGLVYRGLKPVYWCIDCQTALATGEIEYWDESSSSVYVAYPMPRAAEKFPSLQDGTSASSSGRPRPGPWPPAWRWRCIRNTSTASTTEIGRAHV